MSDVFVTEGGGSGPDAVLRLWSAAAGAPLDTEPPYDEDDDKDERLDAILVAAQKRNVWCLGSAFVPFGS